MMDALRSLGDWLIPFLNSAGYALSLAVPVGAAVVLVICRTWVQEVSRVPPAAVGQSTGQSRIAGLAAVAELDTVVESFIFAQYRMVAVVLLVAFGLLSAARGFGTGISLLWGGVCAIAVGWASGRMVSSWSALSAGEAASAGQAPPVSTGSLSCSSAGGALGLMLSSMTVLGVGIMFYFFHQPDLVPNIAGFSLGASLVALFACIGGGVLARSSDSASRTLERQSNDLSWSQVILRISKNLGGTGEMALDIFESCASAMVGTMILGATLSSDAIQELTVFDGVPEEDFPYRRLLSCLPMVVCFLGVLSSWSGLRVLKADDSAERKACLVSASIFLGSSLGFVMIFSAVRVMVWFALAGGCIAGFAIALFAKYFPPSRANLDPSAAEEIFSGPASAITASLRTVSAPFLMLAVVISIANTCAGLYGVGLAALGMLSAAAIALSLESRKLIGRYLQEVAKHGGLDSAGPAVLPETAAEPEVSEHYFTVLSAFLASLVLFLAYTQVVNGRIGVSLVDPSVVVGLLVGAALAGSFAVLTMSALGKTASLLTSRVLARRSLPVDSPAARAKAAKRQIEGLCRTAMRELMLPSLLALTCPLLVALLGPDALGGMLIGSLITGVTLALFVVGTSGAVFSKAGLEQAKPAASDSMLPAAEVLTEDSLDGMFWGVVWPAMNILTKLMSAFALVFAAVM